MALIGKGASICRFRKGSEGMLKATAVIHRKGNAQKNVRSCTFFCARGFKSFCLMGQTDSLTRRVRYGSFKALSGSFFRVIDHHKNGLRDCRYYGYDFGR